MTQKNYSFVCLGGTFDRLHKGHKSLLQKTFEIGANVLIGLTSDEMLSGKDKAEEIQSYSLRLKNVKNYLKKNHLLDRSKVVKISDPYGPARTREELEAIIVTEETRPTAEEINDIRKINGLALLDIVSVPISLAENGLPISSSRIREGLINKNGKVLKET